MLSIRVFQGWPRDAIFSAVLVLGFCFAIAAPAQALTSLTACENNKTHKVSFPAVGKSCTSGETAIVLGATGPQGPPGPQGPTGPAGPAGPQGSGGAGLALVDSTGKIVGPFDGPNEWVYLNAGDVILAVSTDGTTLYSTQIIWYPTSDCSGDGYLFYQGGFNLQFPIANPDGSFTYYSPSATTVTITPNSDSEVSNYPKRVCVPVTPVSGNYYIPVSAAETFNPRVTPPFHLVVTGK